MYSPRWLFLIPGAVLILLGLIGYAVALPGVRLGHIVFDAHTLLFSSLAILCGYQAILFSIFAKTFAMNAGLLPEDPAMLRFFKLVNLERGIALGLIASVAGLALLVWVFNDWRLEGFGPLEYAHTMRAVIPGATLTALGVQTILSGFFVSLLGMHRR
jgi:hypothetical protein